VKKKEGAKEAAADVDLPILIALGKQVRKLRMAAGLSQHQFAEAAGTSHTYIVSIEAGVPNVSVAMLDKMAKVLGISIASFFPDAEDGTEHMALSI
jgi:transcriptional regulator with XRE-family HTH domain